MISVETTVIHRGNAADFAKRLIWARYELLGLPACAI
jgi:hypothetical protein